VISLPGSAGERRGGCADWGLNGLSDFSKILAVFCDSSDGCEMGTGSIEKKGVLFERAWMRKLLNMLL